MKNLLLVTCAAVALAAGGTAALAGDIGLAPASYDWSGGYVGVNAGGALNSSKFKSNYSYTGQDDIGQEGIDLVNGLDFTATPNEGAFTAGVLAGYNMQMSSLVLGIEGDFNYLGFSGTVKNNASGVMSQVLEPENTNAIDKIDYEGTWYGTVRARVGYAMDNFLLYGTGGLAYGQLNIKQKLDATNGTESATWSSERDAWKMGWTVGAGVEYAMDRWTLGLEYLYVDLGTYEWGSSGDVNLNDATLQTDWSQVKEKGEADYAFSVARATLKYRF